MRQSPLEQEIIDGKLYWDSIGPRWYRLLDRATRDVLGTVKHEGDYLRNPWTANYQGATRCYDNEADARWFVEHCVKRYTNAPA